ncbi:hypothetical protein LXL04_033969 [Taraxacum kok-saghyz]
MEIVWRARESACKRGEELVKIEAGEDRGWCRRNGASRVRSVRCVVLGSFENSYIPENPRTPPISYISQTVIPFKKPTSEPSKTGFETKQKTVHICTKKKVCTYAKFLEKKKSFFRKTFFATGLIFERFLAPRSRFFEKVNVGYPRDAPATVLFGEWFRFGKPSDQFIFEETVSHTLCGLPSTAAAQFLVAFSGANWSISGFLCLDSAGKGEAAMGAAAGSTGSVRSLAENQLVLGVFSEADFDQIRDRSSQVFPSLMRSPVKIFMELKGKSSVPINRPVLQSCWGQVKFDHFLPYNNILQLQNTDKMIWKVPKFAEI